MNFSSVLFIFGFLPVFLLAYVRLPHRYRNAFLLVASYAFYVWGTPMGALVLLSSSLVDYAVGNAISAGSSARARKTWFVMGVILNISLLFYFKYSNFFASELNRVLTAAGMNTFAWREVLFPVGVSFFVFHKISYLADIYTGKARTAAGLTQYLTYTSMFPKLLQGPIIRWHHMQDQMDRRHTDSETIYSGLIRFFVGLGKKVLIADMLSGTADAVFALDPSGMSAQVAWLGSLCYTFQIYFDFAGYSDMAIGLGLMLGFRIDENFNRPYLAHNFTEFWRRWHITLSGWFKQYLYIPMGGNRVSPMRLYLNLWVVFLVSGFWHGANWTFIIWGAYHGAFLVLDRTLPGQWLARLGRPVNILLTFIMINLGWVLFRSPDLGHALSFMQGMLSMPEPGGFAIADGLIESRAIAVLAMAFVLSFFPEGIMEKIMSALRDRINGGIRLALEFSGALTIAVLAIAYIINHDFKPYIYFRF